MSTLLTFKINDPIVRVTPHFTLQEFGCRCPLCADKVQSIDKRLIEKLEWVRGQLGEPVMITSAWRSKEHQEDLRMRGYETSVGVSQHELGRAADIYAQDLQNLLSLCRATFQAIGVGRTFLHVDLRDDKPRLWSYSKR